MGGNDSNDISSLVTLINLEELNLHDNELSDNDIDVIKKLTNLKSLWLKRNHIKDISFLVNLTQLSSLSLGENSLSDIEPLFKELINLFDLRLHR